MISRLSFETVLKIHSKIQNSMFLSACAIPIFRFATRGGTLDAKDKF